MLKFKRVADNYWVSDKCSISCGTRTSGRIYGPYRVYYGDRVEPRLYRRTLRSAIEAAQMFENFPEEGAR